MRSLRLSLLGLAVMGFVLPNAFSQAPSEAPTGFDNLTNGFTTQAQFDLDRDVFEESEPIEEGLGPVYNAQSCAECHQNPVTGAISQVTELRAGHFDGFNADAYLNEMGITTPLQPKDNTSNGRPVDAFDQVPDPEDDGVDVEIFARFMRATKAPPRDEELAATPTPRRARCSSTSSAATSVTSAT